MKINKNYRNPEEDNQTHGSLKIQTIFKKIMKIVEFHVRITKFIKISRSHNRISKIMGIL